MDLNSIKSQLDKTESQLAQYGANLPSEIQTQVQSAYTPLLERSLGVTKDLMSDYLGRAMETTSMGPGMQGTTAYDLSPTQRMGVIGRELGTMGGQLNSAISYSDYLGGQMNDLYQKAVGAAQLGQQNLADQYARQFQQYQLAWQEAENAKDRAAAAANARAALGDFNGNGIPDYMENKGGGDETPPEPSIITDEKMMSPGGIVNKNTPINKLKGGVLPNSGGQRFNPVQRTGVGGATNPLMPYTSGSNDMLLRNLLNGTQGPLSSVYNGKLGVNPFKF